jgi:hypothetical protein
MDRQRLPFRSHLMNLLSKCAFLFLLRTRVSPSISQLHSSNSHLLYFSFTAVHLIASFTSTLVCSTIFVNPSQLQRWSHQYCHLLNHQYDSVGQIRCAWLEAS